MKKYIALIPAIVFLLPIPLFDKIFRSTKYRLLLRTTFLLEYPKATDVDWEMEKNCYKVDFELNNNTEYKIWYSAAGDMVKREEEINKHDLPAIILSKIQADFKDLSYR
ncbi:MAG: hypothetical protein R2806_25370 [Saprospiraceae bacterium]